MCRQALWFIVATALAINAQTGTILREYWTGIGGTGVSALTQNINYPDNPTGSALDTIFEGPTNWADNYGTRMRGFLYPPSTGSYIFWISGDDNCELWLSTSADPSKKTLIATVPGWSSLREWEKFPQQRSAAITLTAGNKYYIEALHKEGVGGDNLTVGWQLPDGTYERPIPKSRLSAYPAPVYGNGVNFSYYRGTWQALPDFNSLTPAYQGASNTFSLRTRDQNDCFAYRFTSYLSIYTPGTYTFYTNSDDGSRLYINNQIIVDNDGAHAATEKSGTITLQAGVYPLAATFFEQYGEELFEVWYEGPGIAKQKIPTTVLFLNNPAPFVRKDSSAICVYDIAEAQGTLLGDKSSVQPAADVSATGSNYAWNSDGAIVFSAPDHNTIFENALNAGKIALQCAQSGQVSLEVWIKTGNRSQSGARRILSYEAKASTEAKNFSLSQECSDIQFELRTSSSAVVTLKSSGGVLKTTSDIYHIVALYQPYSSGVGGMQLFVNGILVASNKEYGTIATAGTNAWNQGYTVAIGNRPYSLDKDWQGTIYSATICNKALSASDIVAHFNVGPFWTKGPAAPTQLAAVVSSGNVVSLSWKDNANNESGYRIYRSSNGSQFSLLASLPANSQHYSDNAGSCGLQLQYRVVAYCGSTESSPAVVSAPTYPCAPQIASATTVSMTEIQVAWNGEGTEFALEGSRSSSYGWQELYRGPAKTFHHQQLACQQKWYYRVRASNQSGTSDWSSTASATTASCPINAPTNLVADSLIPSKIVLSWQSNSPNEDGFKVYRKENGETEFRVIASYVPIQTASFTDTTALCNTRFSYYVTAFNVYAESGPSNIVSATTLYCGAGKPTSEMIQITGMVKDDQDLPITGTRTAVAQIYASENGGAPLYEEHFKEVEIRNGWFAIPVGLTGNIAAVIRANKNLFYDVLMDGKSVFGAKLPPLTASPYAIASDYTLSGNGSPVNTVIAPIGASYVDVTNKALYIKSGPTTADWANVGKY
jgi:fibronectin type 3 domain-containing protein